MQAAIVSDRILFSFAVFRSAAGKARRAINCRAANAHQQQARSCSQNARGKSFGPKTGRKGEPISATIRIVWTMNSTDIHKNLTTRLRDGISFRARRYATIANHKQAPTLAAGCSGDIVSTTRSPRRLILVERPKPMSSAFRRQSRWASSPKSQQRPLLRGERSSMSNLFCKASESQPRRSLLLMNAWTSREFALSLPHPPK